MRPIKFFGLALALALASFTSIPMEDAAKAGPWRFIEDKKVSFGVDHDVIVFKQLRDAFRFLKLKVTDGPLRVFDMKVHFDNGEVQDVPLRSLIPEGGESRAINLDGGLRNLEKIEFWYETAGFENGRSKIAVWGRK
jgi:hypothetical protein